MHARISARAQDDLERIYAFITLHQGTKAADRFLEQAQRAVDFLAQHPEAGPHPSWASQHQTLRFWVISRSNYLIYYLLDEREVSIERVLDGRRDISRIMELGEEES